MSLNASIIREELKAKRRHEFARSMHEANVIMMATERSGAGTNPGVHEKMYIFAIEFKFIVHFGVEQMSTQKHSSLAKFLLETIL